MLQNYNYELHISFNKYWYKKINCVYNIENLDKRIKQRNNVYTIILFFRSIIEICKFVNINFEKAKKLFVSGSTNVIYLSRVRCVIKILPNEFNCIVDYIVENEKYVNEKYNIYLDTTNNLTSVEKFLGYNFGNLKEIYSKIKTIINKKRLYDSYYCPNV